MTNSVIIDSSLLVEYIKGHKRKLLTQLISSPENECFINETIISEFLFHFLHINGGASPKSLQSSKKISEIITGSTIHEILIRFSYLQTDISLFQLVSKFMAAYNLLPNDAIILATCKIHNITKLASHDSDFIIPCGAEGIELLREE